jgi:hypothetical protein
MMEVSTQNEQEHAKGGETCLMARTMNPLFSAVEICSLLSSLDKLGITSTLVARQTAKVVGPVVANFGKMTIGNEMNARGVDDFITFMNMALEIGGLADPKATIMTKSANGYTVKWVDCAQKDMIEAGKLFGYQGCPICLPSVVVAGLLGALKIADVQELKVERGSNTCTMQIQTA